MKKRTSIPVHSQHADAVGGIFVARPTIGMRDQINELGTHRDDYFIFFVLTKGKVLFKCDMTDVEVNATSIGLVRPFQIHSVQHVTPDASGYFISVAAFLIPNNCSLVFQELSVTDQFQRINRSEKKDFLDTVSLLHRSFESNISNKTQIVNGLFNALVHRIMSMYPSKGSSTEIKNQSSLITASFKKLVSESSTMQNPSFFAKRLNVTTSHLNDCVNSITGKSVTYWLQQSMITEAQRMLYYTEYDVKEIAYHLGFEDHTYFSRLFKKVTKETPLAFRKKFRE